MNFKVSSNKLPIDQKSKHLWLKFFKFAKGSSKDGTFVSIINSDKVKNDIETIVNESRARNLIFKSFNVYKSLLIQKYLTPMMVGLEEGVNKNRAIKIVLQYINDEEFYQSLKIKCRKSFLQERKANKTKNSKDESKLKLEEIVMRRLQGIMPSLPLRGKIRSSLCSPELLFRNIEARRNSRAIDLNQTQYHKMNNHSLMRTSNDESEENSISDLQSQLSSRRYTRRKGVYVESTSKSPEMIKRMEKKNNTIRMSKSPVQGSILIQSPMATIHENSAHNHHKFFTTHPPTPNLPSSPTPCSRALKLSKLHSHHPVHPKSILPTKTDSTPNKTAQIPSQNSTSLYPQKLLNVFSSKRKQRARFKSPISPQIPRFSLYVPFQHFQLNITHEYYAHVNKRNASRPRRGQRESRVRKNFTKRLKHLIRQRMVCSPKDLKI